MNNNVVKLDLSDWLTENLEVNTKVAQLVGSSRLWSMTETMPEEEESIVAAKSYNFYFYSEYSQSYGLYGQYSQYSFRQYSQYSEYSQYSFDNYSFDNYSFDNYSLYADYSFDNYSLYNDYSFSNYSFANYSQYSKYTDYYFATCAACQVCNVCQGKCESAQKVKDYIKDFTWNETMATGTQITDEDWNKMIKWIKDGAPYNNKTASSLSNVSASATIKATEFNAPKNAMNSTFENANSGIADKSAGSKALASDLVTLASTLNNAKISASIVCCQTKGGQGCITRQDKCAVCQDQRNACTTTCQVNAQS